MEVSAFNPEDFKSLYVQPAQAIMAPELADPKYASDLAKGGYCYSARSNGILVACIGLIDYWPGRRYAWAFLAREIEHVMIPLHRNVVRWLKYRGEGRIETAVDCQHQAAIRWAEMLGFEREGTMRQWTQDGRDVYLYARLG